MRQVLVVDDDPDLLNLMLETLRLAGYDATGTGSGTAAVILAAQLRPQLMIIDLMLPDMTGFAVRDALVAHPETAAIPFLFITAFADTTYWGVDPSSVHILLKPYTLESFEDMVRRLVRP